MGNEIYKRDINSPTPAPEELLNKAGSIFDTPKKTEIKSSEDSLFDEDGFGGITDEERMNFLSEQIKESDKIVDNQKPKDIFDSMFDGIRENMDSMGIQEFDVVSAQVNKLSFTLGAGFSVSDQNAQNHTMKAYQSIKNRIDFSKVDANDWKLSRAGFLNHKADTLSANIWYGEYVSKNGPLTFPKAIELLKDSTLAPENAEFIKTAFGICDGDVLNNKQGSVGSCHLLS